LTLFRTVAPGAMAVSVAEAKANLRIAHGSEDELIGSLIAAATEEVERTTSLALIDQDWRMTLDDVPRSSMVRLKRGPVKEVLSVTAYGADGEARVLDPETYLLDSASAPARLHFRQPPGRLRTMNGIEVDFRAGFGETGADVPDLLKRAILMLVAHWYEFRASFGAASQPVSIPDGYRKLLATYIPRRLA